MKCFLLGLLCGAFLTSCQTAARSTRQAQPRNITSEVDTQPQRIAPTSL